MNSDNGPEGAGRREEGENRGSGGQGGHRSDRAGGDRGRPGDGPRYGERREGRPSGSYGSRDRGDRPSYNRDDRGSSRPPFNRDDRPGGGQRSSGRVARVSVLTVTVTSLAVVPTALVIVATGRPTTVTTAGRAVPRPIVTIVPVVGIGGIVVSVLRSTVTAVVGIVRRSIAMTAVPGVPRSIVMIVLVGGVRRSIVMTGRRPAAMIVVASVVRTVTVTRPVISTVRVPTGIASRSTVTVVAGDRPPFNRDDRGSGRPPFNRDDRPGGGASAVQS